MWDHPGPDSEIGAGHLSPTNSKRDRRDLDSQRPKDQEKAFSSRGTGQRKIFVRSASLLAVLGSKLTRCLMVFVRQQRTEPSDFERWMNRWFVTGGKHVREPDGMFPQLS